MVETATQRKIRIGRRAFELYIAGDCQNYVLEEYALEQNMTVPTLKMEYMHYYINKPLSPKPTPNQMIIYNKFESAKTKKTSKKNNNTNFVYSLLDCRFDKEVIRLIEESLYTLSDVFAALEDFNKTNNKDNKVNKRLARICKVITSNKAKLSKKEVTEKETPVTDELKQYHLTRIILEEFLIQDDLPFDEIMKKYNTLITLQEFDASLKKLTNGNKEEKALIDLLSKKLESDKIKFEKIARIIIQKLRQSSIVSLTSTPFTILDYYRITQMSPPRLLREAHTILKEGKLGISDIELVLSFTKKYKNGNSLITEKEILDYNFNIEGINLDLYNKEAIIRYLKSIPAPLTLNTYQAAYEEFVNGKEVEDLPVVRKAA